MRKEYDKPMRVRVWRSYLCIGFISLMCGLVIFGASNRIILQQTRQAFSDVLKAASSILDGKIARIQNTAHEIDSSQQVTTVLDVGESRPANWKAELHARATKELMGYCQRIDALSSASIFRMQDEMVIASECCTQARTYFDMRFRMASSFSVGQPSAAAIQYEAWLALMQGQYKNLVETVLEGVDGQKKVCYLRSLPLAGLTSNSISRATLMLEIDEGFFTDYYAELGLENDLVLQVISQSGAQFWGTGDAPRELASMTMLQMDSEITGWSYRLYVPGHLLMRQMRDLIWLSLAVVLLLAMASLLLIPRFVEKYYGPVSRMVNGISQKLGVKIDDADLPFVQLQFERLIREQSHTLETMEELKNSVRQVALMNLLLGSGNAETMRELEGGDFEGRSFMVCVAVDSSGRALTEEVVGALSCLMVGEEGLLDGEGVRLNGCAVFLMDCTRLNEEDRQINLDLMQERISGKKYLLAASQMYAGMENIASAYREAKWQAQYAVLSQSRDADKPDFKLLDSQSMDDSARLINRVASRDATAAKQTVVRLFERNRSHCHGNPALASVLTSVVLSELLKNCSQSFPGLEGDVVDTWTRCLGLEDYDQLEQLLSDLIGRMCLRPQNEESSREVLKREIFQYIRLHYTDCNISMESIADAFGKSVATISRAFREGGAENTITAEIARQRIEAACRMLSTQGDMTIAAISREVGYSSMATFMRHFKQQTGVASGRYRELSRNP